MTRTSTSKKSPRAEFGQLALGLFSGRSIGTFIVLRNRNRKLSSFDHFFWGAGPGYRLKDWAFGASWSGWGLASTPFRKHLTDE